MVGAAPFSSPKTKAGLRAKNLSHRRGMTCIRSETQADIAAVHALNVDAFTTSELGYSGEAEIVDEIRSSHQGGILSLVAEAEGKVIGHILFTPVTIGEADRAVIGMALGPMAVSPACQRGESEPSLLKRA